jgi:hypothetical protein
METNQPDQPEADSPGDSYESAESSDAGDLMHASSPPVGAPPTDWTGNAPLKRETVWPTVLAVLSFVCGGLWLFFSGCTATLTPFYEFMASMFEDAGLEDEAADMRQMADLWWLWLIQGAIGIALSILLIAAGVGLIKRTYRGVRLARIWAVLVILQLLVMTPLSVYFSEFHGKEQRDDALETEVVLAVIGAVLGALVWLILPVFMLIWLGRERIRHEIATWSHDNRSSVCKLSHGQGR